MTGTSTGASESVVQPSLDGTIDLWPGVPEGGFGRVLLKLSGEAFAGGGGLGVDPDIVQAIARQIADVVARGTEVAVVIGGGNYFRGAQLSERGMDRSRADYMGMLGTVMNCLALQDFCENEGVETRVQTAIAMGQVAAASAAPGTTLTINARGKLLAATIVDLPFVPHRYHRNLPKGAQS